MRSQPPQISDVWRQDPAVQALRLLFAAVEEAEAAFLDRLGLAPLDPRLGPWRRTARDALQVAQSHFRSTAWAGGPESAPSLFVHCMALAMERDGFKVPSPSLPPERGLASLAREIVP